MIRYSSRVVIGRPASAVFEALIEPRTYERWLGGLGALGRLEVRFDGPPPLRAGTSGEIRVTGGSMAGRYPLTVVDLEPGRSLALTIDGPGLSWRSQLALRAVDEDSTQVDYVAEIALGGLRRMFEPVVAHAVEAEAAAQVERLRRVIEAGPGSD